MNGRGGREEAEGRGGRREEGGGSAQDKRRGREGTGVSARAHEATGGPLCLLQGYN